MEMNKKSYLKPATQMVHFTCVSANCQDNPTQWPGGGIITGSLA